MYQNRGNNTDWISWVISSINLSSITAIYNIRSNTSSYMPVICKQPWQIIRYRKRIIKLQISNTHLAFSAFSTLMLLHGWQEGHPACKNWVVGCWHGYLPWGDADLHMDQLMPLPLTVSCSRKSRLVLNTFLVLAHLAFNRKQYRLQFICYTSHHQPSLDIMNFQYNKYFKKVFTIPL